MQEIGLNDFIKEAVKEIRSNGPIMVDTTKHLVQIGGFIHC